MPHVTILLLPWRSVWRTMSKVAGWMGIGFFLFVVLGFPEDSAPFVRSFAQGLFWALQQFTVFLDGAVPDPAPGVPADCVDACGG